MQQTNSESTRKSSSITGQYALDNLTIGDQFAPELLRLGIITPETCSKKSDIKSKVSSYLLYSLQVFRLIVLDFFVSFMVRIGSLEGSSSPLKVIEKRFYLLRFYTSRQNWCGAGFDSVIQVHFFNKSISKDSRDV